jgi:hypothetical protein
MEPNTDIPCPRQKDSKVSIKWCDLAQYQQLCAGCTHNDGRKRSKYQQRQDKDRDK